MKGLAIQDKNKNKWLPENKEHNGAPCAFLNFSNKNEIFKSRTCVVYLFRP